MPKKPASVIMLHPAAQKVVDRYLQLEIGGKHVVTPYFMNEPGRKARRVKVGKGTAEALERETIKLAKKYRFNLKQASPTQIREFMIKHKLGIDCSGLVAWALHAYVKDHTDKPLWRYIRYKGHPLRVFIRKNLRPVENISARLLTDRTNAHTVYDLYEVRPGDIIRSLNGNHVLLITEVGFDDKATPLYFKYVNSTEYGGVKYGVRYGNIDIIEPTAHILDQQWIDGENGINWTFNAANNFPKDTRIVRLRL